MARGAKVLGIDGSLTNSGFCRLDTEFPTRPVASTCSPKSKDGQRLDHILQYTLRELEEFRPALAVLEGYAYGTKVGRVFEIGEGGGMIKLALYIHKVPTLVVPPTKLQLYIAEKGRVPKEKMREVILTETGVEFPEKPSAGHMCDAYCLALLGAAFLGYETPLDNERRLLMVDNLEYA